MDRSRRNRRRGPLLVSLLVVSALVAAACSSDGGDASDATTPRKAVRAAAEQPQRGGRLVLGALFDVFPGDPAKFIGSLVDGTIGTTVFDPLTMFDEDAKVVPFLATSLESDDKQTWTLRLHPGVTFHDGTPLDAEAVKFNLLRHQDPALGSRQKTNASVIERITVVDALTAEIRLRFPWPAFPESLASPLGWMASPTALRADPEGFAKRPVGTGPFTFVEHVPGDHATFKANPNYWRKGEPYFDEVVFRPVLDTVTRFESAKKGEIQLAQTVNGAELVDADATTGLKSFPTYGPGVLVQFNTTRPPFDDRRLRLAMWHATDVKALNDVVYKGSSPMPPYYTMIEPGSPFFADLDYPKYDLKKAKALVAEVEKEKGPISVTYSCGTQPDLLSMAELIRQMWSRTGIDVKVDIKDQNVFVMDVLSRNFQAACWGTTTRQDPDLGYYTAFHSSSTTSATGYSSPEVDAALDTGRRSADVDVRRKAYAVVQRHIAEDVPLFMANSAPWGWFGSDHLRGMYTGRNLTVRIGGVWLAR